MDVIPAIDLLGGKVVRLYKGDFEQVTEYPDTPVAVATRYGNAGVEWLHIVDLDGARSGQFAHLDVITEITSTVGLAVQVGGGIRKIEQARAIIAAGAETSRGRLDGSARPCHSHRLVRRTGARRYRARRRRQHRGRWRPDRADAWLDRKQQQDPVVTDGYLRGSGCPAFPVHRHLAGRHARRTEPGTVRRMPARATRKPASSRRAASVRLPICRRLAATGVGSVVTGKALLDGKLTLEEIEQFLQNA